jgi:hypothetical protein
MKIIVSHDVDHITFWEHYRDSIIPKFFGRNLIELAKGKTSFSEVISRSGAMFSNRWHRLPELMAFNKAEKIPATFFFGVSRGNFLCYSLENATTWIRKVAQNGFDTGVHGIHFQSFEEIKKEYSDFQKIISSNRFGIRMHYLRQTNNTIPWLEQSGYLFDTSQRADETNNSPYKTGLMWEFPLHIMDGDIIEHGRRYATKSLDEAKELSKIIIRKYHQTGTKYFTLLFHDRYFDHSFATWREWYIWTISYMKSSGYEFISYNEAIRELNEQ